MKRSSDRGKTHRPRSVSSLLILLRAMLEDNVSDTRRCDARVRCEDAVESVLLGSQDGWWAEAV